MDRPNPHRPSFEVDDVWVSVGGDDGVMDVEGQVVKARSSHLVSLDTEPGDSPLETTLAALEQSH